MPLVTAFQFAGMHNTCDPASAGPPNDPVRLQDRAYTQCVDLVNVDVDTDLNISRRQGSTLKVTANATSAWGDSTKAYVVANGVINKFDGTLLTPLGNSPNMILTTEFCAVNDVVAFSDGNTVGLIENDIPYVIAAPTEQVDLLDLETWVKLTYPNAPDATTDSNMEINAFNITTMAGRCLEFYNGALYFALNNFVFCTKTFDVAHMDIRYNVVAGFKDNVTMIKAVNDGLFVGTETEVCFLSGSGIHVPGDSLVSISRGFSQRRVLPYGVLYGSATRLAADKVGVAKARNKAPIWLTTQGVYAGFDGGDVEDLNKTQVYVTLTGQTCALTRFLGACWQYVVTSASGSPTNGTLVLNLDDTAYSRYDGYGFQFTGFFELAGVWYGVNSRGVFVLTGDYDYAGTADQIQIDAYALTPVVDFGVKERKLVPDLYAHARTDGQLSVDIYVDEALVAEDIPFNAPAQLETGARRLRAKLPRGAKGTNWQYKIKNVDGCDFTLFSLKAAPVVSQRSI